MSEVDERLCKRVRALEDELSTKDDLLWKATEAEQQAIFLFLYNFFGKLLKGEDWETYEQEAK